MEVDEALDYIAFLFIKQNEELIYMRWLMGPQFSMSYDEFKNSLKTVRVKSDEDILAEVYKAFEGVEPMKEVDG